MKKLFLSLIFAITLLSPLAVSATANAVDVLNNPGGPCSNAAAAANNPACHDNATNGSNPIYGPNGIMTIVVKILSLVVGIAAVIVIIISAITFVTSGGDSNSVAGARKSLLYALIGIVVAALGQVLVVFVLDKVQ